MTKYIICAETTITTLRNAEEKLSDGLLVAMVLKGLPESFKPFAIHITQIDLTIRFAEFKTKLRSYEDTERMRTLPPEHNVMRARKQLRARRPSVPRAWDKGTKCADIVCYRCGLSGHKARTCQRKLWCSHCKSNTHRDAACRRKQRREDDARKASDETTGGEYAFRVNDVDNKVQPGRSITERGLMVDTGATSHIVTDVTKFKRFDDDFQVQWCSRRKRGSCC